VSDEPLDPDVVECRRLVESVHRVMPDGSQAFVADWDESARVIHALAALVERVVRERDDAQRQAEDLYAAGAETNEMVGKMQTDYETALRDLEQAEERLAETPCPVHQGTRVCDECRRRILERNP